MSRIRWYIVKNILDRLVNDQNTVTLQISKYAGWWWIQIFVGSLYILDRLHGLVSDRTIDIAGSQALIHHTL